MTSKVQFYSAMASYTATHLTDSWQKWTAFLTTASRLYKYPFHEQLMIFAQRPDATACAEYDLWNDTMRRYVRRGSKGIALVDNSREKPRLRYVFDISDTGLRKNSRHPFLWELRPEHEAAVAQALTERFGAPPENNLAEQLESIAAQLVSEYWVEHKRDILDIVDGSFLEGYDEFNIGVQFRNAATVSITYSLLSRCGLEPEGYFDHEDFLSIFDFNTPEAVAALGTAVSQSNQQVLRQIGITIQNYERAKFAERSVTHGEQPDLHQERRLSDPRPEAGGNEAPGPVREDAPGLSEGASAGPVQRHDGERETVPAPERDRADHEPAAGADDAGADAGGGRDGGTESPRSDDLGGADEQLQSPGGGNPSDGTYIQLTLFPSEQEQIRRIDEGPGVFASGPSAVPEPEPAPPAPAAPRRALTQADIDAAIQEWNGNIESKHAVVRYMKDHAREKDTAAWLRQEYGDDLPALPVTVDGAAGDVPWPKVQRRIVQLIKEDRFYTEAEQDRFDNIDPIAIREALAEPLPVPVVWNTGGYERVETLRSLEGKVQVWLPDLKYVDSGLSQVLSGAADYFDAASAAIEEMVRQTGDYVLEAGLLKRGVLIRHLMLPGQLENTKAVLDWVAETFRPGQVLLSLMAQYTPQPGAEGLLSRRVTGAEYRAAQRYMENLGITDGYCQDAASARAEYTPDFDLTGV